MAYLYIQTFIVYTFLILGMTILSYLPLTKTLGRSFLFASLLYACVAAFRYGVGIDYFNYLDGYLHPTSVEDHFEAGFILFIKFCHKCGLGFNAFFLIIAYVQISLLYSSFHQDKRVALFLPIALIMTGVGITGFMNNIRQTIVFCMFVYSIRFIAQKQWYWFLCFIILGYCIHNSAIILLPIYFIWGYRNSYFNNVKVQIVLFILMIIISPFIELTNLLKPFTDIIALMGYYSYLVKEETVATSAFSLGGLLVFMVNFLIIRFSNKMKEFYNNKEFNIIYDFCFIGMLLELIFGGNMILNRMIYYFTGFRVLVIAYMLYYLYKNFSTSLCKKAFLVVMGVLCCTYTRLIVTGDRNTALYVFSFQDDYSLQMKRMLYYNNYLK